MSEKLHMLIAQSREIKEGTFVVGHTIQYQPKAVVVENNVVKVFEGDATDASSLVASALIRDLLEKGKQIVLLTRPGDEPIFPSNFFTREV